MRETKSRAERPIVELIRTVSPPVGLVLGEERLAEIHERQAELRVQRDVLKSGGVNTDPFRSVVDNTEPAELRQLSRHLIDVERELADLATAEEDARLLLEKSKRSWARAIEAATGMRRAAALERFRQAIDTALSALREAGAIDEAIRRVGGSAPASMAPALMQLEAVSKLIEQAITKGQGNGQRAA